MDIFGNGFHDNLEFALHNRSFDNDPMGSKLWMLWMFVCRIFWLPGDSFLYYGSGNTDVPSEAKIADTRTT